MNKYATYKYAEAVKLLESTDMNMRQIAEDLGLNPIAFRGYVQRNHRNLLLKRNGITEMSEGDSYDMKLRYKYGHTPSAAKKYSAAIEACTDGEYIFLNISQIARMFGLDGTALANQLRIHYPDVIPWRTKVRERLAIGDASDLTRGPRKECTERYAKAVELYRDSDMTINKVAAKYGVSPSGFDQHLRVYHRDIIAARRAKRIDSEGRRQQGSTVGNGQIHRPTPATEKKYAKAVDIARSSCLPIKTIASEQGLNLSSFRAYLRLWHPDIIRSRRNNAESDKEKENAK